MLNFEDAWDVTVKSPVGEQHSVVKLKCVDGIVTGTMSNDDQGVLTIEDGKFDGQTLTFKTKVVKPMKMTVNYTATFDEEKNLVGSIKVPVTKMKFFGTLRK